MFRRISRLSSLLAILALGANAASRYPRDASCSSCGQDSPGALSSPWYGTPEEDYPRREFHDQTRESTSYRGRQDRRPILFPPTFDHQESSFREPDSYGIRKSADFVHRYSNSYPVTPAPAPAPRPGSPFSPSRYPFEPFARPMTEEHRPRELARRPQQFPESLRERNYPSRGNYFRQRERIPQDSSLTIRRGDREEEVDFQERAEKVTLSEGKRSRNDQAFLEARRVQTRPEVEDSEEELIEETPSDVRGRRFRIGTVVRPGHTRPFARQVEQTKGQPRKDRSREAEVLRVTQITIDPETPYEEGQPDMSVLRFSPENARHARPFMGAPAWEEEEFVDIRKETPFGASEMISMDKESFGPGGFQEERFTEEFDSFGWRRQAQEASTPGVVVVQSREAPKEEVDLSAEDDADEAKVDEAVMKIAPRQVNDKNSAQKDFNGENNPDFYGDIVYPPTNDSQRAEAAPENTTILPKKAD